jgi:hypothetical protein
VINFLVAGGIVSSSLVIALGYSFALLGCGLGALWTIGLKRECCAEWPISGYLGVAFSLGSGLVAALWLVLAILHLLLPWVIWPLIGAFFIMAIVFLPYAEIGRRLWATIDCVKSETWPWKMITALTGCVIATYGITSFHPGAGDAIAFYLPWPRIIADTGRMLPLPGYESFSEIWIIGEVHTAAVMAIAGDWAARPISYFHVVAAAALLWGSAESVGMSFRGQLLTVAMLFTSTNVGLIIFDGKTDNIALPIGIAAVFVALHITRERFIRHAVCIGLLCGFAAAAKMSYIPPLGATVLFLVLWRHWQTRTGAATNSVVLVILTLAIIGTAAIASVLPQLAKNWTMVGEPLAPFRYFAKEQITWLDQDWYTAGVVKRLLLTYPLALVFGNYWAQHGNLSLLFLAFVPLAAIRFSSWPQRRLWLLTAAAALGLLAWMVLRPSTFAARYFFVVLAILLLVSADGAARASFSTSKSLRAMIVAASAFVLIEHLRIIKDPALAAWRYAGTADLTSYQGDDAYNMARLLNTEAAVGTRLVLFGYYRYPLRDDLLECLFNSEERGRLPSGKEMAVNAYLEGASYLAFDSMGYEALTPNNFDNLPSWLRIEKIYNGPRISIYRVSGGPGSPAQRFRCVRQDRVWKVVPTVKSPPSGQP